MLSPPAYNQGVPETKKAGEVLKCEEEGHTRKECGNEEACPPCEEKKHMAGTAKCYVFKKPIKEAREK